MKEESLLFPAAEVDSSGKNFVKKVVECLRYVDGHHDKLKKQSAPVSDYFARFTGYNIPQLSKHRKRQNNLSSSVLKSLAASLFRNLQSFWSSASFRYLQQHTNILAQSLANYSDYLSSQNRTMKTLHVQPVLVRQLSDALSIKYVQPYTGVPIGRFSTLTDTSDKKEDFEHLFVTGFAKTRHVARMRKSHNARF